MGRSVRRRVGFPYRGLVTAALTVVMCAMGQAMAVAASTPAPSPVTVTPSWENAPWQPKVQVILNVTAQVGIACCLFAFLAGGAAMAIGRVTGSYQAGNRGLVWLLGGGGGALVIASAAPALNWLLR
jgi:hypothetical protein